MAAGRRLGAVVLGHLAALLAAWNPRASKGPSRALLDGVTDSSIDVFRLIAAAHYRWPGAGE